MFSIYTHLEDYTFISEDLKKVYLIFYNLCQFVGFTYIITVMAIRYFRDGPSKYILKLKLHHHIYWFQLQALVLFRICGILYTLVYIDGVAFGLGSQEFFPHALAFSSYLYALLSDLFLVVALISIFRSILIPYNLRIFLFRWKNFQPIALGGTQLSC